MTTTIFTIDTQSRITRIGAKAKRFDSDFGCYVQSYVFAKKVRNTLIVSELAYKGNIDLLGVELSGIWKVIKQDGKNLICSK
jgi:hypothetical protein